jgi:hypothetical protein
VFHRPFTVLALVVAALLAAPPALAVRVHIRVEGKTRTIFGATAPVVDVTSPRANPLPENALDALATASVLGEFYYHVAETSSGPYVDQVGRYRAEGQTGWALKVNGKAPAVVLNRVFLHAGDSVLWYWAQFGIAGGPKTLVLSRAGRGTTCYRVHSQDDKGRLSPALGAVLRVGGRTVPTQGSTQAAVGCVGKHRGLVRAELGGAVRSNALP